MIKNIRPVSDLRNKYPEIEDIVLNDNEVVYLTKNGYGSMVVVSLEKYSNEMKHNFKYLGQEEGLPKLKGKISGK